MAAIKVNVEILKNDRIPFIFAAKPKNTVTYGTKNTVAIFNRNVNEFEEAFVRDMRVMSDNAGADDNDNELINAQDDEIVKMKVPLSLANNNEIRDFARYLIVRDRKIRIPNSNNKKIKYGDVSWKPSFWPDDMFCWTSNRKNFSNIRIIDFPGNHSILDVLREAIKRCLENDGKDPENHFDKKSFTDEMKQKRMKNRGIVQEQITEDDEIEEPEEVVAPQEAAVFIPSEPNMYGNNLDNDEREVLGQNETTLVVNTDDIGDELDVDNFINTVKANAETEETQSAKNNLRRSRRNISLVSYSKSPKSDLSSESASSFVPSLDSISESTLSDNSTLRRSKRKRILDNSDNLVKKSKRRRKVLINESLERLIRPPSVTTQQKEQEQAARQRSLDARRREEQRQDEERLSEMEKAKQKREKAEAMSKKN